MNNIRFPSVAEKDLAELGKYSMPKWLTHTYFSIYLFHDFIYGFCYPLVIFVVLVIVSLMTAVAIIYLARAINNLAERRIFIQG